MFLPSGSALFRQYTAGIVSQLAVAVSATAYMWLEPFTIRMTEGEGVLVTAEQMSWLIATVEIGCILAPIPSGYLADWYGRKIVTLCVGPLCLLGWLLILLTNSLEMLFVVRIIQGIATGIAFTVVPIYTAETVDPSIRGAISGIFQIAFYGGAMYSFCTGPFLSYTWYICACIPPPLLFTLAFPYFPESPYWLLKHGREEEAKRALSWFKATENVGEDIQSMKAATAEEMALEDSGNAWKTLFMDKVERKAFVIVQIVSVAKFLTGMPTVVTYASETFARSKSFLSPHIMTIILGFLLTFIGGISAYLSDRVGRKALLLISCFGCFVAHFFTGLYYYLHERTDVDTGPYIWMLYGGLIAYCFFSDIGLGPLLQTLQAEMFGAKTREIAGGITEAFGGLLCFFIIKIYQPINVEIGVYFNFWLYSAVGLIGGVLLAILMYETAGKTIGRMEGRDEKPSNNNDQEKPPLSPAVITNVLEKTRL